MKTLNDYLIHAFEKGYRIDSEGCVRNPNNLLIKSFRKNKRVDYLGFSVKINNEVRVVSVHRLGAYQKYGDKIFEKDLLVRHSDGNPLNNKLENLILGNQSSNMMDRTPEERSKHASKSHNNRFENRLDKNLILEDLKNKVSITLLSKKYNIGVTTLYDVRKRYNIAR